MNSIEMNKKVKELRELRRLREELDAEITAVENGIKAEMTARNVDTLVGNDWRITWHKVSSTRFDSVAFKKANPAVYNMFVKSTEGRRFVIA